MEKRAYGKSGEMLSIIGFGGIIVANMEQREADNYVAEAIDRGINYFDVAPSYADAEDHLGPALRGKRDGIFLACKTEKRTKKEARESLEQSLRKLETDYFDLFQLHAMTTMEDVETVFGPDGAMEVLIKAQQEGLIRHIGFSAHNEDAAVALMDRFDFESVLFPLNWVNLFNSGFGNRIMNKAEQKGVSRLALKAMARAKIQEGEEKKYDRCWYHPVDDKELASLALRYTLSQPVTAAIPPGDIRFFRWALETAAEYKPITEEEVQVLKRESRGQVPIFA
jgi:aryl-alcohol dehydrogenase-like predicted oxidoreductase